jgi:hypothetical protein
MYSASDRVMNIPIQPNQNEPNQNEPNLGLGNMPESEIKSDLMAALQEASDGDRMTLEEMWAELDEAIAL